MNFSLAKGYIYVYRIYTPSGVVIKVGHGMSKPELRMKEYAKQYKLNVIPQSLHYCAVSDSNRVERYVHKKLKLLGYRNIRDNHLGS